MTRIHMCRAAVVTLILGVAAAACSGSPESAPGGGGTTKSSGGSSAPASPAPPRTSEPGPSASTSVLTEGDSGRTVTLARGGTVQLRLSSRWRWEAPTADGDSIVLIRVDYESDPGFRAWEVRAVHPGTAVIRANGRPGPRSFRMTVHVDG
ncbi:hypothetical protein OHA59_36120 [Streptomyces sp. NBC_01589]|uniref:hypothetical protein n=1 Tax=Streptomyces sp. NBC_01589 TaxID=2975886 RepID=UPI00386D7145